MPTDLYKVRLRGRCGLKNQRSPIYFMAIHAVSPWIRNYPLFLMPYLLLYDCDCPPSKIPFCSILERILPMARVGLSFFGQT